MAGTRTFDAVVVGAGTAGANAAYQLARRGLSVAVLERRPADRGGAQWHNGVLDRQFERAGLAAPSGAERTDGTGVTHLVGPDGTRAITVRAAPTVRADMGLLGRRLRGLAVEAGVALVDGIGRLDVELLGDRVTALAVERPGLGTERIVAPLFVDASGRRGVLRRRSPLLRRWCPEVRGGELCSAADHEIAIDDADGAKRFLERHEANPGEGVTVLGLSGGFSTRAITVSEDLDRASVLVGCLANGRYGTGPRMLAELRADEPWLGASISGGAGTIPLRRPYSRITAPGLALVGDAACQVFPAHGSGIGTGLIAGTALAEAVAGSVEAPAVAADPGDPGTLWRYQFAFQAELGGLLAANDAVRRMSTLLGTAGVTAMVRAGLMDEAMAVAGLDQRWPGPAAAQVPDTARRLVGVPGVAVRMLPMLARGQLLYREGVRHPAAPDEAALVRWDARVRRLLGPLPA